MTRAATKVIDGKVIYKDTPYNEENVQRVIEAISTCTTGLRKMCENDPTLPSYQSIMLWRLKRPEFRERYFEARKLQAEVLAEDIQSISDESNIDMIETFDKLGNPVMQPNPVAVARAKLRINTRQWTASRLLSEKYSEKSEKKIEVTSQENWIDKLK